MPLGFAAAAAAVAAAAAAVAAAAAAPQNRVRSSHSKSPHTHSLAHLAIILDVLYCYNSIEENYLGSETQFRK